MQDYVRRPLQHDGAASRRVPGPGTRHRVFWRSAWSTPWRLRPAPAGCSTGTRLRRRNSPTPARDFRDGHTTRAPPSCLSPLCAGRGRPRIAPAGERPGTASTPPSALAGRRTPTPTLPRRRERGQAAFAANAYIKHLRVYWRRPPRDTARRAHHAAQRAPSPACGGGLGRGKATRSDSMSSAQNR